MQAETIVYFVVLWVLFEYISFDHLLKGPSFQFFLFIPSCELFKELRDRPKSRLFLNRRKPKIMTKLRIKGNGNFIQWILRRKCIGRIVFYSLDIYLSSG